MGCEMEYGGLYPSIKMKIHGQLHLIIKNSPALNFKGIVNSHSTVTHHPTTSIPPKPSSSTKRRRRPVVDRTLEEIIHEITIAPLNRVMLMMQSQSELIKSGRLNHPYRGLENCFDKVVRNEGIRSHWRGNTMRIMTNIIDRDGRLRQSIFGVIRDNMKKEDNVKKELAKLVTARCLSYAGLQLLVHPLLYAETRMANDIIINGGKRQFNGLIDVFRKTIKSDGIAGIYRGYTIGFVSSFVNAALYFAESCYVWHELSASQVNRHTLIIFGFGVPLSIELITHPAYTIMRRMMMRSGETTKYRTCFHAFSQIVKNEGFFSLYKGASARVLAHSMTTSLLLILPSIMEGFRSYVRNQHSPYFIDVKWKNGENKGGD